MGLDDAQESLRALMRTNGFSVEYMDEARKEELRMFLVFLHVEKAMSLNDVANMVGNKTSGYTSWLLQESWTRKGLWRQRETREETYCYSPLGTTPTLLSSHGSGKDCAA